MDLRSLPAELTPEARVAERRRRIQEELGVNLSLLATEPERIGMAEQKNCEQMFGTIPLPVGLAGPLRVTFGDGKTESIYLPLATTEAALVASVNRGAKALSVSGVTVRSIHHGVSRSMAFWCLPSRHARLMKQITELEQEWKAVGESTSAHLKILGFELDATGEYVFLTIRADTGEAMGMNMITICCQEIGTFIAAECECEFLTVAANIDSDKKPSQRTHDTGRGYEVIAEATLSKETLETILKSDADTMQAVADAKLEHGSRLAGAIGKNLHAANIIAALYLATGQDAAHTVEGSLCDTTFQILSDHESRITIRLPAVLVGIRGGGTTLPAQKQCLDLLLGKHSSVEKLAESIGAAVLAGEISLLAAQATHTLASSHRKLAR